MLLNFFSYIFFTKEELHCLIIKIKHVFLTKIIAVDKYYVNVDNISFINTNVIN